MKRDKDGFAIFKDEVTGMLYLRNLLKTRALEHPRWTLLDLCKNYAPASDENDTERYVAYIAKRLSVDVSWRISNLIA